ncbi:MAG TPA: LuxR C-terminal-related transcriptional regulator [Candidatus Limnocylindrales bacterium]|nr:LuxR C-terminal-related transcriptional regulator [Candidatus Limnocylindrales bacterium]
MTVDQAQAALAEAQALFLAGEFRRSADLGLRAAELAKEVGRTDLITAAAMLEIGVPDPATAAAVEHMCRDALRTIDAGDLAGRARLHGQLAVALHHRERFDEAAMEVEQAATLAAQAHDPLATAATLHARQLSVSGRTTPAQQLSLSEQMLDAAVASGSPYVELLALTWRIDALLRLGDARRAGHEIDVLDVLAARTGEPLFRWNALFDRAGLEQAVGRFDAAEEHARQAARLLPEGQRAHTGPLLVAQLMLVATDRGVAPPEIELVRAVAIGGPMIAVTMTARFDLEVRDRSRARATFDAIRPRIDEVELDRRGPATLAAAAELATGFGDADLGSILLQRLQPFDGVMIGSALGVVGPTAYFIGRLEGLLGRHDDSVGHLEAALELASRGGFEPWIARSRLALAEALVRRAGPGDLGRARTSAEMARAGAAELGMRRLAERADGVLASWQGPRLSAREHEVADLVSGGASNREIAAALFVSERTVETHIQHILTKLGFHARSQVAAWVVAQRSTDGGT